MFGIDTFSVCRLHPLVVHVAVVLVPLAALALIAVGWRKHGARLYMLPIVLMALGRRRQLRCWLLRPAKASRSTIRESGPGRRAACRLRRSPAAGRNAPRSLRSCSPWRRSASGPSTSGASVSSSSLDPEGGLRGQLDRRAVRGTDDRYRRPLGRRRWSGRTWATTCTPSSRCH